MKKHLHQSNNTSLSHYQKDLFHERKNEYYVIKVIIERKFDKEIELNQLFIIYVKYVVQQNKEFVIIKKFKKK